MNCLFISASNYEDVFQREVELARKVRYYHTALKIEKLDYLLSILKQLISHLVFQEPSYVLFWSVLFCKKDILFQTTSRVIGV